MLLCVSKNTIISDVIYLTGFAGAAEVGVIADAGAVEIVAVLSMLCAVK